MVGKVRAAVSAIRRALLETLPSQTSLHGETPDLRFTHLPASHAKALHPNVMLVVGMRGAGKSFWWAALQQSEHRRLLDQLEPDLGLEAAEVRVGFGERPDPDAYPSRDVLASLVRQGHDPRLIWKTVALNHLVEHSNPLQAIREWSQKIGYVEQHSDTMERLLVERDNEFATARRAWILLFDAMDRSATDWPTMHKLIRGVLQLAVEFRAYRRLRLKCFLRTDQFQESAVADFPDASKILSERVELSWPNRELYRLMWQHLGNAPGVSGKTVRETSSKVWGKDWRSARIGTHVIWRVPHLVHGDDERQKEAVHAVTGPWMGSDHRRGFPYSWIPGHLSDGRGQVSPRSFLSALRAATEDTIARYEKHEYPLHYESIKRGVQSASEIRVAELREDYPWVGPLMEALRGLVVPCGPELVDERWNANRSLTRIAAVERLPPAHLNEGAPGLRDDLEQLGLFVKLRDGRINIPDVFRVGYGIGRKGGVPPVRRASER